jgi:hypothetical protein
LKTEIGKKILWLLFPFQTTLLREMFLPEKERQNK